MKKASKTATTSLDLNFPVFEKPMHEASIRSMDEIDKWIEQDYKLFFNREEYEKNKAKYSVYDRFTLDQ